MSIKTTAETVVAIDTTEIFTSVERTVDAESSRLTVDITPPQEVVATKKEYSIVGDQFYAGVNSGIAPEWLTNLIDSVVAASVANGLTDYDSLVQDVRNAIDSIDVAKNTYVEQINFTELVDGIVGSHLTTLNATYEGKFATIVGLDVVASNAEYALATSTTDLKAKFKEGIDAKATELTAVFTSADKAFATNLTSLTTAFTDQESNLSGVAEAVTGLNTFVGLDPDSENPGVISESGWFVDLQNDVTGEDGHVAGALSTLKTENEAYANSAAKGVESKFAYNSTLFIDDKYYTAGFGLSASGITQTEDGETAETAFKSEFWVNAETFVLKNPNFPDVSASFTVNDKGLVLSADQIIEGVLSAERIDTDELFGNSAVFSGSVRGGKAYYADADAGYFLGYDDDEGSTDPVGYKFAVGDRVNYMKWNGDRLTVKGDIAFGEYVASSDVLLYAPGTATVAGSDTIGHPHELEKVKEFGITTGGSLQVRFDARLLDVSGGISSPGAYEIKLGNTTVASGIITSTTYTTVTRTIDLGDFASRVSIWIRGGTGTLDEPVAVAAFIQEAQLLGYHSIEEKVLLD